MICGRTCGQDNTVTMERDRDVMEVLNEIVARRPRWGFWKLHDRLRLDGHCINHKRLHRVYCALGLNLPRRTKRRLPTRPRQGSHRILDTAIQRRTAPRQPRPCATVDVHAEANTLGVYIVIVYLTGELTPVDAQSTKGF